MNTCPACHNTIEECDCFSSDLSEMEFKKHVVKTETRPYGVPQEPLAGIKKHGTSGYTKGCRCGVCRKARTLYRREFVKNNKGD